MNRATFASGLSVGFVLFVATVLTITALFLVGSGAGLFSSQVDYYVDCPSTSGLKTGTKVYLSGVPVGVVGRIDFVDDLRVSKVRVELRVSETIAPRIRDDSRVELRTEGLLGDVAVHISMGNADRDDLPVGELIPFRESSMLGSMVGEEISGSANDLLRELAGILRTIESGEGSLGKLVREPELYDSLTGFSKSLDLLAITLNTLASDIQGVIDHVENERGPLGKLLFADDYEQRISRAIDDSGRLVAGLERLVASVDPERSVVMRLLNDPALGDRVVSIVERLDRSLASAETILAIVERGEGSVGALVHDRSIVESLRDVFLGVQELGYLRTAIRNAEAHGRESSSRVDRASQIARFEASRARFLATIESRDGADAARPVPAASREEPGDGAAPAPVKGSDESTGAPDKAAAARRDEP